MGPCCSNNCRAIDSEVALDRFGVEIKPRAHSALRVFESADQKPLGFIRVAVEVVAAFARSRRGAEIWTPPR